MHTIEVAPGIFWVGAVDWNIRDFHGYSTEAGTTYNAFLIMDEKITLVDTVKAPFADELLQNISRIVDPSRIDQVISNHTEMDHSGGLPRVMHRIGEKKPVYCSPMGKKALTAHFGDRFNLNPVADGATLSLGKRTLTFLETRMLHWPDSMFTYSPQEKILFSSDAFGQHYAGFERFDDEMGEAIMPHALKYFANILLPYSGLIEKLVEKVTKLGLSFDMILPDHGLLWRKDPGKIVSAYARWSAQKPCRKAVVIYDTMWKSTQMMAEEMAAGIAEQGVEARPLHLRACHRSDVMTEVMEAGIVAVGSPTLNNGIFPTVADFLTYMKGLRPKNKIGAAFGSYGWSGEAANQIHEILEAAGFSMLDAPLRHQYVPAEDTLTRCADLGRKLGSALVQKLAE
ncbi:MAG: FprA family A-type flavoprotein [Thermodesulfobacteriota bacterium]